MIISFSLSLNHWSIRHLHHYHHHRYFCIHYHLIPHFCSHKIYNCRHQIRCCFDCHAEILSFHYIFRSLTASRPLDIDFTLSHNLSMSNWFWYAHESLYLFASPYTDLVVSRFTCCFKEFQQGGSALHDILPAFWE